jgi:uncharacterized protein YqeY
MTLKDQLDADLRDAMRAGDDVRRSTLRLLISAIRNAEIPPEMSEAEATAAADKQREALDDAGVLEIIRRQVKQRRDSVEAYTKANRPDLVAREEAEAALLAAYLPAQMSRDEIASVARRIIEQTGASGPADKGKVMPLIMAELKDRAEGREINAVVTELLSQ